MASQVLSGTGSVSYTNNTGQNVRAIINYIGWTASGGANSTLTITWGGSGQAVGIITTGTSAAIGKNLAYHNTTTSSGKMTSANASVSSVNSSLSGLPTELMLSSTQLLSVSTNSGSITGYNILIVPENG